MAQGAIKKSAAARKAKPHQVSRSKVTKKPQKKKATSADKVQRKFTAGLVAKTEKLLGERAGHLELIGKGKKGAAATGKEGEKGARGKQKGGTRKFG